MGKGTTMAAADGDRDERPRTRYRASSWLDPRVIVAPSLSEGCGLFTREPIEVGEVVVQLGGDVPTDDDLRARNLVKYGSLAINDHLNLLLAADATVTSVERSRGRVPDRGSGGRGVAGADASPARNA